MVYDENIHLLQMVSTRLVEITRMKYLLIMNQKSECSEIHPYVTPVSYQRILKNFNVRMVLPRNFTK